MSDKIELKEFNEQLNRTFEEFKTRNDKAIEEASKRNGEATAETQAVVEKINTDLIEMRKSMKEIETRLNRPNFNPEGTGEEEAEKKFRAAAFVKWLRYGLDGEKASWTPEERRSLSSASDGTGSFLVPIEFESGIIMNAYNIGELRPVCQVGTTGRDTVQLGSLSKPTVAWGRSDIAISTQTLTAGGERITIYPLRAIALLHNDTLDDAEADINAELNMAFARAVAEAEDDAFAAGAGDDSPRGVAADTRVQALYVASGIADALSDATHNGVDALTDVLYTPKKTYRRNGTWAFNSTTEAAIRKLKDGEGRYLWQPPVQEGRPALLLGKPIVNPEGMPDIGAGTYPIVFGDFMAGYKIRDRKGLTVQRLVERYAEYEQTGFKIVSRTGGQVTLAEAFAPLKIAAS
ncbi:MAG: phage major capsid protein [Bacteroidota bacterium]